MYGCKKGTRPLPYGLMSALMGRNGFEIRRLQGLRNIFREFEPDKFLLILMQPELLKPDKTAQSVQFKINKNN